MPFCLQETMKLYGKVIFYDLQHYSRPPRENRPRERDRTSVSRDDGGDSDSQSGRQQRSRFPDSQQLFVGNLPHNITEKELEDFFKSK